MSDPFVTADQEKLNLLHTLLEHMPDRIYAMDCEGRYVFDNKAHREFLGVASVEGVVGKTVFDFFPSELAETYRADDHAVLSSGKPLMNREEPITGAGGETIWVSTTKVPQYGADGKLRGLVAISRDITASKLAHDQVKAINARLEADLALAGETQAALFPDEYPDVAGSGSTLKFFDYHHFSHAVGGDFFSVVPFAVNRVGVFICDVMGHGVQSALVSAMIHAQFQELTREDRAPDVLMRALDHRVTRLAEGGGNVVFATAVYLVIDLEAMTLRYAHAGHPSPIVVCRRSRQARFLIPTAHRGPALGLLTESTFMTCEIPIESGQSVFLFTDGLIESARPDNAHFGMSRLLSVAEDGLDQPAGGILDRMLDAVKRFTSGAPAEDDVCLLAIDVLPRDSGDD